MPETDATPLVSILVNNFNYGRYVGKAVRSALGQSHRRLEVIVVDDGSTDDSLVRLARIRDPRLTVVRQANLGQGAAYNAGWARAQGRYVVFLDADDVLDADVVERCLAAFAPGTTKVQFAMRVVDARGRPTGALHPPELEDLDCDRRVLRFGLYASPPGSGNMYERGYLDRVMPIVPPEAFPTTADSWCVLMAPFFGTIRSLPQPGGCYRVDRPDGVDALRVIGNANADPLRNVRKTVLATERVFAELRRHGRIAETAPRLPSPPLLRAWVLARLNGDAPGRDELWGSRPTVATIVRSVLGWRAYGLRKRVVYIVYLCVCRYLPRPLARGTVRIAANVLSV